MAPKASAANGMFSSARIVSPAMTRFCRARDPRGKRADGLAVSGFGVQSWRTCLETRQPRVPFGAGPVSLKSLRHYDLRRLAPSARLWPPSCSHLAAEDYMENHRNFVARHHGRCRIAAWRRCWCGSPRRMRRGPSSRDVTTSIEPLPGLPIREPSASRSAWSSACSPGRGSSVLNEGRAQAGACIASTATTDHAGHAWHAGRGPRAVDPPGRRAGLERRDRPGTRRHGGDRQQRARTLADLRRSDWTRLDGPDAGLAWPSSTRASNPRRTSHGCRCSSTSRASGRDGTPLAAPAVGALRRLRPRHPCGRSHRQQRQTVRRARFGASRRTSR